MGDLGGLSLSRVAWPAALWEMATWCYSYLSWSTGQHLRQNKRGASPTAARPWGRACDLELCSAARRDACWLDAGCVIVRCSLSRRSPRPANAAGDAEIRVVSRPPDATSALLVGETSSGCQQYTVHAHALASQPWAHRTFALSQFRECSGGSWRGVFRLANQMFNMRDKGVCDDVPIGQPR